MKNRFNKILIVFLLTFTFISNVNAELSVGSKVKVDSETWTVTDVQDASNKCNIDNPTAPSDLYVEAKEFPTIGYTYENTCKKVEKVCTTHYTIALTEHQYNKLPKNNPPGNIPEGGEQTYTNAKTGEVTQWIKNNMNVSEITRMNSTKFDSNIKKMSSITENRIKKLGYAADTAGQVWFNGFPGVSIAKMERKGWFVAYFYSCSTTIKYNCVSNSKNNRKCNCPRTKCDSESSDYDETCFSYEYDYQQKTETNEYPNWPDEDNVSETSISKFAEYVNENIDYMGLSCQNGYHIDKSSINASAICILPYFRAPIEVCTNYCALVEPTKVEVYGYDLKINNKEAYCVTPAAGYNEAYTWDTRFNVKNCKNSLQMYNKDRSVSYNVDCGYAYIMAEAKRINAEAGKEIFNYGVISTAMKLFGTGIVGNKDENGNQMFFSDMLDKAVSNKAFLEAAGYYTTYYGWGGPYEYVGIPWPRGGEFNKEGKTGTFAYFMPEFYSIYINTAKVAGAYLKDKIRFVDVGNLKDANGKTIYDPFYYLKTKKCEINKIDEKTCNENTKIQYNDAYSQALVNIQFSMNPNSLNNFLQRENATNVCFDKSLGVLCGEKDEKGNADYVKAIYLYMRALQGNEIVFEEKITNSIEQYKPVEGLTKFLYELDENGEVTPTIRFAIDTKVETQTNTREIEVDCDGSPGSPTASECKAEIFVFDSKGKEIYKTDHYDYCKKNYCYVKVKSTAICKENSVIKKLTALVVTDPSIKSTIIKKIDNGIEGQQIIFVYDETSSVTGGFCQEIEATKEELDVKCPCNPTENANEVVPDGNVDKAVCDSAYKPYDELFYGDPSMSTILNACYEEDKLKYEFTDELNINGNDIMYSAEYDSKYSFQAKSDDFGVCKLYCRDESRFYIANKISVKAGQHLKYDIGQSLLDKKVINETIGDRNDVHNYMPSVVLELRECTSVIDYPKWEQLYKKASGKEKNQLLYSIYNCNLYTTEEIKEKGKEKDGNKILQNLVVDAGGSYGYGDITSNGTKAEPAMIDYKYDSSTGNIKVEKVYGTTKDYLLSQEGCTSLGYSADKCSRYGIVSYDDDYLSSLGINITYEHGLVKSNLNETIYCSGEGCYKFNVNGKYLYNPNATNKNDYTTVDKISNSKPESAKILSYNNWALNYKEYDKNSKNYKKTTIGSVEVPTNQYASFIVVTETGYYNDKKYYTDRYTGVISTTKNTELPIVGTNEKDTGISQVELDKNIYPLHLKKETGEYNIHHKYNILASPYKRSNYYIEKNYSLFDSIKLNGKNDIDYYCTYDLYNPITKYQPDNSDPDIETAKKGLGIVYRAVNLEDIFESVTKQTRKLPENWATSFAQENRTQIEASSNHILEIDGNNNGVASYLEYSYVLTPEGIKEIKKIANLSDKLGGYLDNTLYGCEYDEEEGIYYNCKSVVLSLLEKGNGITDGSIIVNKGDGISEFCLERENENEPWCKYQQKATSSSLLGGE